MRVYANKMCWIHVVAKLCSVCGIDCDKSSGLLVSVVLLPSPPYEHRRET